MALQLKVIVHINIFKINSYNLQKTQKLAKSLENWRNR